MGFPDKRLAACGRQTLRGFLTQETALPETRQGGRYISICIVRSRGEAVAPAGGEPLELLGEGAQPLVRAAGAAAH